MLTGLARQDHNTMGLATMLGAKDRGVICEGTTKGVGSPVAGMSGFRCPIAQYYEHD